MCKGRLLKYQYIGVGRVPDFPSDTDYWDSQFCKGTAGASALRPFAVLTSAWHVL